MTVSVFDPAQSSLTVTDAAREHFARQVADSGQSAVRLSLTTEGCSGYMYQIDFVDSGEDGDREMDLEGVTLFVEGSAMGLINGTVVDYVQEGLNRLLKFNNPNADSECGCGESFSIGDPVTGEP